MTRKLAIFDKSKTNLDYRRWLVCHGRDLEVGLGGDGPSHAECGAHEEALVFDPHTWNCHHLGFMINISEADAMLRVKGFVSAPLGFTLWSLKSQDLWSVKQ